MQPEERYTKRSKYGEPTLIARSIESSLCLPTSAEVKQGGSHRSGLTLVEVMVAMSVMALALTSSALCLHLGMMQYDTARSTSYATQVLQDEAEGLRLSNWTSMENLPAQENFAESSTKESKFNFSRSVTTSDLNEDMKDIWLIASWNGLKGETHEIKLFMKYAKSGTYDYYYGSNS